MIPRRATTPCWKSVTRSMIRHAGVAMQPGVQLRADCQDRECEDKRNPAHRN